VWDAEVVRHIIGGLVVASHRGRGRPSEVVVQNLSQPAVFGYSDICKSLVEAGNRTAIHFVVLPVAAVHLDYGGLVTIRARVHAGSAECFGPVSSESLDMLRVETVAEGMPDHVVCYHPTMPGVGKTAQTVHSPHSLEYRLHPFIMTIIPCLRNTMAAVEQFHKAMEKSGRAADQKRQ
jgi:hypothetical protein